tara:strand:- start:830 stop:1090 length:261 start_codon:yes stop_codon:yes gene_type:complete
MKKKKDHPLNRNYQTVLSQIQALDIQISDLSNQINQIKENINNATSEEFVVEDVCLDEIEANKAALEAMRGICLEAMLDTDPQGEA